MGQHEGHTEPALAHGVERDVRVDRRHIGERLNVQVGTRRSAYANASAEVLHGARREHPDRATRSASERGAVHPGLVGEPGEGAVVVAPCDVHLGRLDRGRHVDRIGGDVDHPPHLNADRRDRSVVDAQPPRVVTVDDGHQTIAGPSGRTGDELDPVGVVLAVDLARGTRGRVDVEHGDHSLVAGLHDQRRPSASAPQHVAQVLELALCPVDGDA